MLCTGEPTKAGPMDENTPRPIPVELAHPAPTCGRAQPVEHQLLEHELALLPQAARCADRSGDLVPPPEL